ncbi:hypothetical protein CP8484711_1656, partial [Chlamydia psittaci 84-8471/1]
KSSTRSYRISFKRS